MLAPWRAGADDRTAISRRGERKNEEDHHRRRKKRMMIRFPRGHCMSKFPEDVIFEWKNLPQAELTKS